MAEEYIDIVFDGPPDLQAGAGRFVEVENGAGHSINVGQWIKEPTGRYWRLRIPARQLRQERDAHDALAQLIQDLHDSEINGEIGWFFDGVWRAKIGDPWNGYRAEKDGLLSLAEATEWLRSKAMELYPDSEFAKGHSRGFE